MLKRVTPVACALALLLAWALMAAASAASARDRRDRPLGA
jgi:hypothetical protein